MRAELHHSILRLGRINSILLGHLTLASKPFSRKKTPARRVDSRLPRQSTNADLRSDANGKREDSPTNKRCGSASNGTLESNTIKLEEHGVWRVNLLANAFEIGK
ncbi:Uncharacterized protein Rs2_41112 [Raphanus sativus]|nr:Uncharacterized protein Rs2_41112 [Raphanus sativus]